MSFKVAIFRIISLIFPSTVSERVSEGQPIETVSELFDVPSCIYTNFDGHACDADKVCHAGDLFIARMIQGENNGSDELTTRNSMGCPSLRAALLIKEPCCNALILLKTSPALFSLNYHTGHITSQEVQINKSFVWFKDVQTVFKPIYY
jgi:hypothetical protein